jgi:hypothetical protein
MSKAAPGWAEGVEVDRRAIPRREISCPMVLTPIDETGTLHPGRAVQITSRNISESGLGFVHDSAIPYKRAVISFELTNAGQFAVEVHTLWTHINTAGKYQSGCRMIRKAADHTILADRPENPTSVHE